MGTSVVAGLLLLAACSDSTPSREELSSQLEGFAPPAGFVETETSQQADSAAKTEYVARAFEIGGVDDPCEAVRAALADWLGHEATPSGDSRSYLCAFVDQTQSPVAVSAVVRPDGASAKIAMFVWGETTFKL